jgi:hypothetical protein
MASEEVMEEEGKEAKDNPLRQLEEIAKKMGFKLTEMKKGVSGELDWEDFEEIEVLRFYPGNPPIWEIVKNGTTMEIRDKDILTQSRFRLEVLSKFGIMLPPIRATAWAMLVNGWKDFREVVHEKEEDISEEQNAADTIIELIESSTVVDSKEKTFVRGFVYVEGERIFIPSEIIQRELLKKGNKTSLRNLAYVLRDCLSCGSKLVNVKLKGRHTKKRFWIFKTSKFPDVKDQKPVSLEDEKESNEEIEGDNNPNQRDLRWPGNGENNPSDIDNGRKV